LTDGINSTFSLTTSSAASERGDACGVASGSGESSAYWRGSAVSLTSILDRGQFIRLSRMLSCDSESKQAWKRR